MIKMEFLGFPHTDTYCGGEVTSPITVGTVFEVSAKESKRLLDDFKEAGAGKKPAFRVAK